MTEEGKSGFFDRFIESFSRKNLIYRALMFVVFGILTAFPYVISNLDQVWNAAKTSNASGLMIAYAYFRALMDSVWTGIWIGLSTLYEAMSNITTVVSEVQVGTMIYSVLILFFATMFFLQPIRILFGVTNTQKDQSQHKVLTFLVSMILVLVLFAPLSHMFHDGGTLTSGLKEETPESEEIVQNSTQQENESIVSEAMATLDLINGG